MQLARRRWPAFLEGVFARGDRRLGKVLEQAFEHGCKFDGFGLTSFFTEMVVVFEKCGVDPTFYNQRRRSFDEVLPWDHIDYGIKKSFLKRECEKAYQNATTPNCQEACSNLRCSLF